VLSGTVRVEAGHCHIASGRGDVSDFAFPENIEAAIATRVSDLSPAAQLTLKVASIEGQIFAPDHVAAVRPGDAPRAEIATHLDSAAARHLVDADDTRPGVMRFRHSLIVETLYNLLLRDQRRDLHARSANVHESTGALEPGKSVLLARHWERGGQVDRAITYLERAAAEAETAQRPIEAARFLTRALDLNATCDQPAGPEMTGDWNRRAGNALQMLGEVRRSIPYMERAVADLTGVRPLDRGNVVIRILSGFAALKTRRMNPPQPAARRRPLLQAADTCGRLAFQYYELQQIPRSIGYTLLMVNLGKTAGGDSAPLAQGNANLAIAAFQLSWLLDQDRHRRYALQMRDALDDPACDHGVSFIIGILDTGCARLDSARDQLGRARDRAKTHLGRLEWDTAVASLANMCRPQGRFEEAVALDLQVLESAREWGVNLPQMWALHGLCRSYLALGDMAALNDAARRLRALVTDPDNDADSAISNNLSLLVADGVFAMNAGHLDAAAAPLARAARLLGGVDEPQVYLEDAPGYIADAILRCHLLGGRGMAPAARACHRGAKRLARLYPVARPKASLLAGDRAFIAGRRKRAAHHWARSARIARDLGLPLMEAQATARLALPGCGPPGSGQSARARAERIFRDRLGLPLPDPWQRLLAAAGETAS
jgi:tetratricopeptide (TPR) repeat protein